MWYVFVHTWGWLAAAFLAGMLVGGWLAWHLARKTRRSPGNDVPHSQTRAPRSIANSAERSEVDSHARSAQPDGDRPKTAAVTGSVTQSHFEKPPGLPLRPADADDLKRIKGVGPAIERALNNIGVYRLQQVATLSQANIAWIDANLGFPGRVVRDRWIQQAKQLTQ